MDVRVEDSQNDISDRAGSFGREHRWMAAGYMSLSGSSPTAVVSSRFNMRREACAITPDKSNVKFTRTDERV